MALNPFLEGVATNELRIIRTQPFPDRWREFCNKYDLVWHYTPFERRKEQDVSGGPGVYCFHVGHDLECLPVFGVSLYGGSTQSLRNRFIDYFHEKNSTRGRIWVKKFLHVFDGELNFAWSEVDIIKSDIKILEKQLNDALMPPYSIKDFSADVRAGRNAWS